jgi:hypothetical protein
MHGWLPRLPRAVVWAWVALPLVLLQAAALAQDAPPLKRLDGPMRARVLAAIAGLIILGFGLVLLTWLGARMTQRYRHGTAYFRPTPRPGEHDWARRPLAEDDEEERPSQG